VVAAPIDAIVAIDFGTTGTGFSVLFPPRDRELPEVVVCKPGEGRRGDKALTAVLLNPEDNTMLLFGSRARAEFADRCDAEAPAPALYFETFKMSLAPTPARPRDVTRIAMPAVGVVAGGGPGTVAGVHPTRELMLLVQHVLRAVKKDAYAYLRGCITREPDTLAIQWVLTVPAIWDDEGKAFMREAAVRAGLIRDSNSPRLLLALEPEAALVASLAALSPAARADITPGKRLMVVDCGGGTMDITVDEVMSTTPLLLREVAPPGGGSWGATNVDKQFVALLKDIVGEKWGSVDHTSYLRALGEWEVTKTAVNDSGEATAVSILVTDIIFSINAKSGGDFTTAHLAALVVGYNARHGLAGADAVTLSARSRLGIPAKVVQSLYMAVINPMMAHIQGVLDSERVGRLDYIVLVGGFSESSLLQNVVRSRFETATRKVISPLRPGQAVVVGAALFGLQPHTISSRVMRWSYAYLGAEAFNPEVHDERHAFTTGEGRKLVNILFPLVTKDTSVDTSFTVNREGLIPVRGDQVIIDFDIYRTSAHVTNPRTEPDRVRTVPVEVLTDAGRNIGVLRREKVATLSIPIGATDRPRTERTVELRLSFATTEIVAHAISTSTGERKEVRIRYD